MMADILLSPALHLILFAGSIIFTLLAVRRQKLLWTIPAALCTICACLLGLAADRSPEQLLTAVLIPTAILLFSQGNTKGGGEA